MNRKKTLKKLVSLLLCGMLLSACGMADTADSDRPEGSASENEVTITDDLGREVTLETPKRVAVLIGSFADIWCLAGGKDTIVAAADNTWTEFDLGLSENVVSLGGVKTPNVELLLAAQPDFVIGSTSTIADLELRDTLEQAGIPVAYFGVNSVEEYLHMLKACTQITGCVENYETYGTAVQAEVDAAKERADGSEPTVLYIRATGSSCKVKSSQGNVLGEMLADLGCKNIADSETSLLENLSMEAILACDPQYIFVVLQGADPANAEKTLEAELLSNPAWRELTAVQEGRCYTMDQRLYNLKPNAKWGVAYEKLADILYPET